MRVILASKQRIRQRSSGVEQRFRKPQVDGSNPFAGCIYFIIFIKKAVTSFSFLKALLTSALELAESREADKIILYPSSRRERKCQYRNWASLLMI